MANYVESANPLVYAIQCHLLAILSFWDDHIIVIEKMTEKLFPTSAILFNKIDDIVLAIMLLPPKFNDALNKFPEIIHRIPFIECVLFYVISWLNCLIFTFNRWGLESSRIKEIKIDVNTINDEELEALNCHMDSSEIINNESKESSISASESEASEGVSRGADIEAWAQKRGLYKEEHSQKKKSKKKRKEFQSQKIAKNKEDENEHAKTEKKFWRPKIVKKEEKDEEDGSVQVKYEVGECGRMMEEDPILGLFESGWTMKHMT